MSSNLVGGLGGLFGLAITTMAALAVINIINDAFRCNLCGYTNKDKDMVISHVKMSHPNAAMKAHQRQKRLPRGMPDYGMRLNYNQHRRPRRTEWVYHFG